MDTEPRPRDTRGSCKLTPSCPLALSPPIYPGRGGKLTLHVHLGAPHMSARCLIYCPTALGLPPVVPQLRTQTGGAELSHRLGAPPPRAIVAAGWWQGRPGSASPAEGRRARPAVSGLPGSLPLRPPLGGPPGWARGPSPGPAPPPIWSPPAHPQAGPALQGGRNFIKIHHHAPQRQALAHPANHRARGLVKELTCELRHLPGPLSLLRENGPHQDLPTTASHSLSLNIDKKQEGTALCKLGIDLPDGAEITGGCRRARGLVGGPPCQPAAAGACDPGSLAPKGGAGQGGTRADQSICPAVQPRLFGWEKVLLVGATPRAGTSAPTTDTVPHSWV